MVLIDEHLLGKWINAQACRPVFTDWRQAVHSICVRTKLHSLH